MFFFTYKVEYSVGNDVGRRIKFCLNVSQAIINFLENEKEVKNVFQLMI